jgi:hypothetical protein
MAATLGDDRERQQKLSRDCRLQIDDFRLGWLRCYTIPMNIQQSAIQNQLGLNPTNTPIINLQSTI